MPEKYNRGFLELSRDQGNALALKMFGEYYSKQDIRDITPDKVSQREFGVGDFERKIKFRHMEFKGSIDLKSYLTTKTPAFISCSTAYYSNPSFRPMENKGWLGSELVFDIDANDMHLPCQKEHGSSWVCDNCLRSVKDETIKLIEEFLIPDFGFSSKEIGVNFSGNRGYHVRVDKESVLSLDSNARKEISDYITGTGIGFEDFFSIDEIGSGKRIKRLTGPRPTEPGWRGRIARSVIKDLNTGIEHLVSTGIDKKVAKNLYNKRALIEMGINNGNWDMVYVKDKAEFWSKVIKGHAVAQSDRIDKNVTNDTGHLLRLPNTIHGDTGLVSKRVTGGVAAFEPMDSSVVLPKDPIKVKASTKAALTMKGETFGPYPDETVELPGYAAMYLYLKGFATLLS